MYRRSYILRAIVNSKVTVCNGYSILYIYPLCMYDYIYVYYISYISVYIVKTVLGYMHRNILVTIYLCGYMRVDIYLLGCARVK